MRIRTGKNNVPPPIPPAFDIALAKNILIKPIVSLGLNGRNELWRHECISQWLSVWQSESTVHTSDYIEVLRNIDIDVYCWMCYWD